METQSSVSTERLGPSFICFLIWTFISIARPQDFMVFLVPLRPVLVICVVTIAMMFLEGVSLPRGIFNLNELRLVLLLCLDMLVGTPFAVQGFVFQFLTTVMPAKLLNFLVTVIQVRSLSRLHDPAEALGAFSSARPSISWSLRLPGFPGGGKRHVRPERRGIALRHLRTPLPVPAVCLAGQGNEGPLGRRGLPGGGGDNDEPFQGRCPVAGRCHRHPLPEQLPRIRGIAKVAAVVLLAFVFMSYFSVVEGRFQDMGEDYNLVDENGRINLWKQNLAILGENPVLGTGTGCSAVALGLFRAREGGSQTWLTPHSSILQVAVETGIPGVLVFIILNLLAIRQLRRVRGDRDHPLSRPAFFVELAFYGFWAGGLLLSHGYSVNLYFLLGISAAIRYLYTNPPDPQPCGS